MAMEILYFGFTICVKNTDIFIIGVSIPFLFYLKQGKFRFLLKGRFFCGGGGGRVRRKGGGSKSKTKNNDKSGRNMFFFYYKFI